MNLRTIVKYGIYAVALIPLVIFSQYISPFHFGKVIVFRSLIEILLVLYVWLAFSDPSYRPKINKLFWAFLGFTGAFTLTTALSHIPYMSFWGTLERMGGLWTFWHYFLFYVIATAVLRTKEEWLVFLKITVVVGLLSAFYGFGQRTNIQFFIGGGGRERIFGTIGNAALFAGYEIINFFLAVILFLQAPRGTIWQKFYAVAVALIGLAILMTVVRGSTLGLGVGCLLFAWLYFKDTHSQIAKKVVLSLLIGAVLFVGFAFTFRNSSIVKNSPYLSRMTDFSPKTYTVNTRFWAWQAGLEGWSESPTKIIFGWGPENFNIPFSEHFNPKFYNGPGAETLFDRAHNMFIEILVTMGLIGFLAYLGMFWALFRALNRMRQDPDKKIYAIGIMAMTVAYMIHNLFIFDTSANFIAFFTIYGFSSFLNGSGPVSSRKIPSVFAWVTGLVVVVFAIYGLRINILQVRANKETTGGIVGSWQGDFNGAVGHYRKALSYNVPGRYEFRNNFSQFLLEYTASKPVDDRVAGVIKEAVQWEQKNASENSNDYLPELYLARLNIILGKDDPKSSYNDEALVHANKALSYSPTFVRTYYEVAQAYLNKKDYPHSIEAFNKALELNPNVGTSYWYLAAVQMESGDINAGLATSNLALSKGYQPSEQDYLRLANVYIKRADYPNLVKIYEGLAILVPNNAQYHASLAVAYVRVGRIDDAVVQARLAAKLDMSFAGDAQRFVESLGRKW